LMRIPSYGPFLVDLEKHKSTVLCQSLALAHLLEYKWIAHLSSLVKLLVWTGWCMQLNMVSEPEVSSSSPGGRIN
jgi:hypothetical protein